MADTTAPTESRGGRGGFGRGRGGRGRGGRGRRGGRNDEEKQWVPVTKLGRLVKDGKIKSMEQIYLFSLPVKGSPSPSTTDRPRLITPQSIMIDY
ncbi:40S ribosomal protein [Basidiobolus ranarum]|uniref:40S ribosomal protein n=1 Tax=Basidiobolus ranarum TaxID=34480 RepID=A0ABR2W1S4_9FUNG